MTEVRPGVWHLRVYAGRRDNGSPIQIRKTVEAKDPRPGAGRRLAERELAAMVAKVSSGNVSTGSETVEELLNAWLDHIGPNRSPTTIRKYRDLADRIVIPELGKVRLKALTARQLDRLYGKLTAKGNKATSVRRVHALIAAALHQAERWDMVDHSVARKASPPPIRPQPVKAPTPEEVRAIVAKAEELEPALAALLLLGALTGARRGELCALRWTDLDVAGDPDHRPLRLRDRGRWLGGKGDQDPPGADHRSRRPGPGVLAKHRAQVDELAGGLKLEVRPDGFMFSRSPVGAEPMQPDFVSKFAKKVATKAGVDTHLHALRHFSATQAIAAGFDPTTVAGRLGHRDSSITLRVYSHVLEGRDRDLAEALGKTLALPG